jgi:hypothetical protein
MDKMLYITMVVGLWFGGFGIGFATSSWTNDSQAQLEKAQEWQENWKTFANIALRHVQAVHDAYEEFPECRAAVTAAKSVPFAR